MGSVGIKEVRFFVPGEPILNDRIIEDHGFDRKFVREKLGILSRHIAEKNEYTSDLATAAGAKLLDETDLETNAVDLLIVVTQTPDYCLPQVSALVQDRLGLPSSVAALDINLGCSGYVYGLSVAKGMMEVNGFTNAILITAETYSKIIDPKDRATAPLFGDGAAATWLGLNPTYKLGHFNFGTFGKKSSSLIARGSGMRRDSIESLYMNGQDIFNFVMSSMPKSVTKCLEANELTAPDIDVWIFHQASRYMLEKLGTRLKIPNEKILIEVADIGNTTSSTIPIALCRGILSKGIRPKIIFLSGFGVGLSWASGVIRSK
jgi:3-oxoacyl-[acyl-carrier-protein] synthase III